MSSAGRLRVLLVLGTSGGGTGRHVAALAAGLRAAGHDVAVAAPAATAAAFGLDSGDEGRGGAHPAGGDRPARGSDAAGGTGTPGRYHRVEFSDRPRPLADAAAVRALRRVARGADVVHAHGLRAGGLAVLALRGFPAFPGPRGRPRLVVTLHNALLTGGLVGSAYAVLERLVAHGADAVLGVSADLEDRMRELGAHRVEHALVPAPPSGRPLRTRQEVRAGLSLPPGTPLLLTVARLADQKGLPVLLDAAALLADREPVIALAGDGPLHDSLADRIAREHLPVRLLGRRDDVAALLATADIVLVPSVWEGQPLIVQEALRAGAPIVATDAGGTAAVLGGAGVLVPPGDAAALAAAVGALLDDPLRRGALSRAARQRAAELPTERDAVVQVASLYADLQKQDRRLLA